MDSRHKIVKRKSDVIIKKKKWLGGLQGFLVNKGLKGFGKVFTRLSNELQAPLKSIQDDFAILIKEFLIDTGVFRYWKISRFAKRTKWKGFPYTTTYVFVNANEVAEQPNLLVTVNCTRKSPAPGKTRTGFCCKLKTCCPKFQLYCKSGLLSSAVNCTALS